MSTDVAISERRLELSAVLQSKEFQRSPALARLLEYLCEKTFQGKIHEIKEFSIATEVFGRDQQFGEKRDSLVRVEVYRLRKRLQHYYDTEGLNHPLRIVVKPGTYCPEFEHAADPVARDIPEIVPIEAETAEAPPEAHRQSRWPVYAFAAMAALLGAGLLASRLRETPAADASRASLPAIASASVRPVGAGQAVRILAGSSTERSVDRFGVEWLGDRYFVGGNQNKLYFGSQERSVPHPIIRGAPDQTPFRSFRFGDFSYRIPLPPGKYELKLYFSEVVLHPTDSGDGVENQRVFDVNMNGKPLLPFFDIASDAGAAETADIRVFENVSADADGFLKLDFHPIREAACLNAIEIIPNNTGRALPIRVVTRNANFTDHKGQLWGIDRYYFGGKEASDNRAVSGTNDPELFTWQRYGHFSYRFPVPSGKYKLRLLFAETFFGPGNRGQTGVGSRVFNVYCSGVEILRQFDIFKEAGENRALEKVFHGITPNPQGRIDLTFEPLTQYAIVQAIELTVDE